jgi:acyl transferase domain-containing protein/acyl carrier protein
MSTPPDPSTLSAEKQALLALRKLRARVDELERARSEPIAIVGIGCRFPGGVNGPDEYWRLLREGTDAISEVPSDRWDIDEFYDPDPDAPGKMYTRHGGFIAEPDRFDPHFFGISPREAVSIDPQHRLILEVSWEALEHAGQNPDRLHGESVGVFVGISTSDYGLLHVQRADPTLVDTYFGIGNAANAAAGRVAYTFGFQGPAMAVDTACSSSLVAVHVACQSLRSGDCRVALAGGVNLILAPDVTINFSRARMMAPDGRCKTFDAAADGYVRGEGCGVIVLKRLSDAVADRDRILAVVRGSAVNQDGRSSGFTAPNELAQEAVIRQALRSAGLKPADVQYLEAHGTGTSLGDPIEVQAAAAAYGDGRAADEPLKLGSVKTNFGHLEAAAGIAGLIKLVLALQHGEIPRQLHFRTPNPYIPWAELPVEVVNQPQAWAAGKRARAAGVSSFGFSGTNAHVIVGEAPAAEGPAEAAAVDRPRQLLALSAKSGEALQQLAARYADRLAEIEPESLADICYTANTGRALFPRRLAAIARSTSELRDALGQFARGESTTPAIVAGEAAAGSASHGVVFLFTGQGAQYAGMARQLFDTQPAFRATLERCDEILRGRLERPLLSVIYPRDGEASPISETAYTQPVLFAIEYAVAQLWRSWGVEPAAVIGHSVGEYVAACVAGVINMEDALLAVAARGRLMQSLPAGGGMAAVFADAGRIKPVLAGLEDRLTIAAMNAPENTVISGAGDALEAAIARLAERRIAAQRLDVSHAFHSPLMAPILDEFEREISSLGFRPPRLPIVSNLTGEVVPADFAFDAAYWRRHLRDAVRFAEGLRALVARGHRVFLEVGPQPTLASFGRMGSGAPDAAWLASLRKGRDDWEQMLSAAADLHVRGIGIDWAGFDRGYARRKVSLPTYPFQRERYWIDGVRPQRRTRPVDPIYEVRWREQPRLTVPDGETLAATAWVVFQDATSGAPALADRIRASGARVLTVHASETAEPTPSADVITINPAIPGHFAAIWQHLKPQPERLGIVYGWGNKDERTVTAVTDLQDAVLAGCGGLLHLFQSLSSGTTAKHTRVTLLTRGAQPVAASDVVSIEQTPLLGLLASLALEFPEIECGSIDLTQDADVAGADGDALLAELADSIGPDRVGFRNGVRHVARLARLETALPEPIEVRDDASYLVTGGLGALGLIVARRLVERGARHVTLVSRRQPDEAARAAIRELETAGATITCSRADVAIDADVARLMAEIARDRPPLRGIVHAAGVRDDGVAGQQTRERFARVVAPKVAGSWNLHAHTRDLGLDFFVLFSSSASVFGSPGQVNYSAANAFLGALAHERRRLGLPATSVAWGPWADGGMASGVSASDRQRWEQIGLEFIQPAKGLDWLERIAATAVAETVVLPADWGRFATRSGAGLRALLQELVPRPTPSAAATPSRAAERSVRADIEQLPRGRRRAALDAHVRDHVRHVLALAESAPLRPQDGFRELGMDSLMAVDLRNRLQRSLDCALPATVAFDHPTVEALTTYIGGDVLGLLTIAAADAVTAAPSARANEPIAIIGIGCRLPGGASDPEAFWRLLNDGVDAIREVPADRWDVDAYFDPDPDAAGKMYTRWGGFLDGIDRFDPRFFGMTPREAISLDPQQRLLLEVSWEALEHAGQRADALRGSPTGVFVGISGNEYVGVQLRGRSLADLDAYAGTGNAPSMAAGRLSFTLGLQGPSFAVDTACSSSLVAVHLACQSLRVGESRLALAGGVNLILSPTPNVVLSRARMMSADGRCKTFDAAADGYVRGEGCGVVVLKRLHDAIADGDNVLAVIRGTAVNQDGRSSGLTVPNGLAQETLIREALDQSDLAGEAIGYVEAHGTGTSLGDPIEVRALSSVLCSDRSAASPLRIGSVKTNLGHLEAAAGIAGLIKTVLALRHETVPPHLHFSTPNPLVPWAELPIHVPTAPLAWPRGTAPRLAGVSSFGFSGTNAHVVVEEAPLAAAVVDAVPVERPVHLLTLSARSDAGLRAVAEELVAFLSDQPAASLADVCFTANAGRAHFEHRLAVTGASIEEMRARLAGHLGGGAVPELLAGRVDGTDAPRVVFRFTGEPAADIDRELLATQPTFRRSVEQILADAPTDRDAPGTAAVTAFAAQYALAELWRSWGVVPAAVAGSGAGEFVAGCVAGVLTMADALRLAMASRGGAEALREAATNVACGQPHLEMISAADGRTIDHAVASASYWSVMREPGATPRIDDGVVVDVAPASASWRALLRTVAALEVRGTVIDWVGFDRDYGRRKLALPTYPFQRERYWVDAPATGGDTAAAAVSRGAAEYRRDWIYDVDWQTAPAASGAGDGADGRWLVLADEAELGASVRAQFERRGGTAVIVRRNEAGDTWSEVEQAIGSSSSRLRGVVCLWGADASAEEAGDVVSRARQDCGDVIRLVRVLAGSPRGNEDVPLPKLWMATRGAHLLAATPDVHVSGTPLWGLGRTIAAEHAPIWGGLVDLDPAADVDANAAALVSEIAESSAETQVAFRRGQRHVPRLVRHAGTEERSRGHEWKPDGAYLITGGFGGIGLEVARAMARQGARRLILMSRSAVSPRAQWHNLDAGSPDARRAAAITELEALGATVDAACVDVGDEQALERWLSAYRREQRPRIRGVIHAAGVTQYRALADHSGADFDRVWRGKASGAWSLHRLFADSPLDCFVLFSSAASVLDSPMLGSYAAANAFLDGLADLRRHLGLPVTSVNWANWSGVGMAAAGESGQPAGRHEFIPPAEGLRVLDALLDEGASRAVVLPIVWSDWRARYPAYAASPFFSGVLEPSADAPARRRQAGRLIALPEDPLERRAVVAALVSDVVSAVVRLPAASLTPGAPLRHIGIDSLMALEIRNQMQERLGVSVPLVTIVEGPSMSELTDLAVSLAAESSRAATAQPGAPETPEGVDPGNLDELSDENVDAMLRRMLAER